MKAENGTVILSMQIPFANHDSTRTVEARADGLHLASATNDQEWGFVRLFIVGRFETVSSRARLTINQARALFANQTFQTSALPDNQKAWLKEQIYIARGMA